jgi:uncharacterized protein YjbI with pentapeptide repeats
LASWHGNGRTTTVKEIEKHCNNSNLETIFRRFQDGFNEDPKASVTRLLTAFYFRQSGHDHSGDRTFEFTHKSFGEYLTAKRIVREIKLIDKKIEDRRNDPDEGCDEREALQRWALLCGSSGMDEYLFAFVLDEMRLQKLADVASWQKTICRLIESMLRYGMPMERLSPRPNFQEENRQARNAEEALLAVLNTCARITTTISKIDWATHEIFGTWINLIGEQRIAPRNQKLTLQCLSFLDLELSTLFHSDLCNANLHGSNLRGSRLTRAILYSANLVEADLSEAVLCRSDLADANLEGANLTDANLGRANLEGAKLRGADLRRAKLRGANLRGTILESRTIASSDENLGTNSKEI